MNDDVDVHGVAKTKAVPVWRFDDVLDAPAGKNRHPIAPMITGIWTL